jgi:hypothetical protein
MRNKFASVFGQAAGMISDGVLWLAAVLVLGVVGLAIGFVPLHGRPRELLEAIHLNTVYAVVLVASASIISRLVVVALERMGQWERGE